MVIIPEGTRVEERTGEGNTILIMVIQNMEVTRKIGNPATMEAIGENMEEINIGDMTNHQDW